MKSSSLDQKLKEKEDELKKNEQEIADQDEVNNFFLWWCTSWQEDLEQKSITTFHCQV